MIKFKKILAVLLTASLVIGNNISVMAADIVSEDIVSEDYASYETAASDDFAMSMEVGEEPATEDTEKSDSEVETAAEQDAIEEDAIESDVIEQDAEELDTTIEEIPLGEECTEVLVEETDSEDLDSEDEDRSIEGSFPGVDITGFCSDPEILEEKEELSEAVDIIVQDVPNVDYVEGEVIVSAPDEDTAEIYAEGFGGKLGAYLDGYALILLDTDDENNDGYSLTVAEAVLASADEDTPLPAARPNYMGEWAEEEILDDEIIAGEEFQEYQEENTSEVEFEDIINSGFGEWESIYNDPFLKGYINGFQYQHALLQSEVAWRAGYDGSGVGVAILDSGMLEGHDDLKTPAQKGVYNTTSKKFVSTTSAMTDPIGHGTHCSGIVAAIRNNGVGGAGIAPGASLYIGQINNELNSPDEWGTYCAINYILNHSNSWPVQVINISSAFNLPAKAGEMDQVIYNAYKKGIAVFVASGNYYSNQLPYPAVCPGAIPVGAVNAANVRLALSNNNSQVRYSGPGYEIVSTCNGSSSDYQIMTGTSMASPAIAAVAAVILSSGKVGGSGAQKVENLKKIMDKGCIKSGIGKGTPNLAKALDLSYIYSAPKAPTASVASGVITDASKSIIFKSSSGTTIWYDTKGRKITYKNGVVSSNAVSASSNSKTVTLNATDGGKQKVTVVAIDNSTGLCSKMATYNYTFKPKVTGISVGSKKSDFIVSKGSSLQLVANITPSCAANKSVTWSIPTPVSGVSISKSGKLTVAKTTTATSVTVKVAANDGSSKSATKSITISSPSVKTIKCKTKNVTLYTGKTVTFDLETYDLKGNKVTSSSYLKVSSSNENVATASLSTNTVTITGKTVPGKTVISCYSKDGTYKKVSVNVKVLQAVTAINASTTSLGNIVQGGSAKPSVSSIDPANASNKSLKWSLYSVPTGTTIKTCGVSVNAKTGQVKVGSKAFVNPSGSYKVRCVPADGQSASVYKDFTFSVKSSASRITKLTLNKNMLRIFRVNNSSDSSVGAQTSGTVTVAVTGGSNSYLSVSSSAPKIATVSKSGSTLTITATGKVAGSAKITVRTTDGTNLKKEIKVSVVNPPSRLKISPPAGKAVIIPGSGAENSVVLGYNKSMKLIPTFYSDYGPIDSTSKKLRWESSSPNIVSVSSNGTVKTVMPVPGTSAYNVRITAYSTDGSGVWGSILVSPNPPIKKLSIYKGKTYKSAMNMYIEYVALSPVTSYSYIYSTYTYKISGPKNGISVIDVGGGVYEIYPYKHGNYSITFTYNDGSNKKATARFKY